jgi:hypothetical protein
LLLSYWRAARALARPRPNLHAHADGEAEEEDVRELRPQGVNIWAGVGWEAAVVRGGGVPSEAEAEYARGLRPQAANLRARVGGEEAAVRARMRQDCDQLILWNTPEGPTPIQCHSTPTIPIAVSEAFPKTGARFANTH